ERAEPVAAVDVDVTRDGDVAAFGADRDLRAVRAGRALSARSAPPRSTPGPPLDGPGDGKASLPALDVDLRPAAGPEALRARGRRRPGVLAVRVDLVHGDVAAVRRDVDAAVHRDQHVEAVDALVPRRVRLEPSDLDRRLRVIRQVVVVVELALGEVGRDG